VRNVSDSPSATIYAGRPISAPAVAKPQHDGSWRAPTNAPVCRSDSNHMRRRGAKSFVDDLVLSRGVVLSRADLFCDLLRLTGSERDRAIPEGGPNGCEACRCVDPKGAKTPKGEHRQAAQLAEQADRECNGLEAWMQPDAGANQQLAAEPKSRTGTKIGRQVSEVAGQDLRPRDGIRASEGLRG